MRGEGSEEREEREGVEKEGRKGRGGEGGRKMELKYFKILAHYITVDMYITDIVVSSLYRTYCRDMYMYTIYTRTYVHTSAKHSRHPFCWTIWWLVNTLLARLHNE